MTDIIWNPRWQLDEPATFDFNADGSMTFKGGMGDVFLPDDYIAFMQKSEGAALRDKGAWFIARFDGDAILLQIEWLGSISNLLSGTWRNNEYPAEPERNRLPPTYVFIGYAEPVDPAGAEVVMNVVKGDPDYGKVYAWVKANDPWMTGDNTLGLGHVADSFTAFMNGLTDRENL